MFVKLHLKNEKPVWINPSNICWMDEYKGLSVLIFIGDDNSYIQVSETPEEIVKLLKESEHD